MSALGQKRTLRHLLITLSARPSSDSGGVRPSALVAFEVDQFDLRYLLYRTRKIRYPPAPGMKHLICVLPS
jgi:hypothetical protein